MIAEYIGIAIVVIVSAAILVPQAWRSLNGREPFGGPLSEGWSPRTDTQPYWEEARELRAALADMEQAVRDMTNRLKTAGSDSPSTPVETGLGDDEAQTLYIHGYLRGREQGYAEGWREGQKVAQS
jgi:hypothetical protein